MENTVKLRNISHLYIFSSVLSGLVDIKIKKYNKEVDSFLKLYPWIKR